MKISVLLLLSGLCLSCGDDKDTTKPGTQGKYETYLQSDLLGITQLTFLKGRCISRMSINSKDVPAKDALIAFSSSVAASIPLDGSTPKNDQELTSLIPGSEELSNWKENLTPDPTQGPWLETVDAYEWINGSGDPFQNNGFEAVTGEFYEHATDGWKLKIELVNQGTVANAEKAFTGAGWNTGEKQ